jgi:hypothetical protein
LTSINHAHDESNIFPVVKSPILKEGEIDRMTPRKAMNNSEETKQQNSVTTMSVDFDNLFKMKEEYIFVFCKALH